VDANNPYRPPISDAQVAPGFVDPGTRARMLANALLVYCAVAAASGGATVLYALSIMDGRSPTPDDVDPNTEESIQLLTMFAHAIVFLTTVVLYGRFAAQANRNAQAASGPLSHSPASMVWWYFVPIANLWKPYTAVREVWRATFAGSAREPSLDELRFWWAGWVMSSILDNISLKLSDDDGVTALLASEWVDVGSHAVMIVTAVFLRRWVLVLDAEQRRAFARAGGSAVPTVA
jgi:hypothetical protein